MADDRYFLYCKNCGEKFYVAKRMAEGFWHIEDSDTIYADKLMDFLQYHIIQCADIINNNFDTESIVFIDELGLHRLTKEEE